MRLPPHPVECYIPGGLQKSPGLWDPRRQPVDGLGKMAIRPACSKELPAKVGEDSVYSINVEGGRRVKHFQANTFCNCPRLKFSPQLGPQVLRCCFNVSFLGQDCTVSAELAGSVGLVPGLQRMRSEKPQNGRKAESQAVGPGEPNLQPSGGAWATIAVRGRPRAAS